MPRRSSPYDRRYQQERRALLASGPSCALQLACDGVRATSADHDPPLALHAHVRGSGCCRLQPACQACQRVQGGVLAEQLRLSGGRRPPAPSRRW